MGRTIGSIAGFLVGVGLTVGLLLSPHLIPGGFGYRAGLQWPLYLIIAVIIGGLAVLALTLWIAGRLVRGANSWKEPKVIGGAVLIAFIANALYCLVVELFSLGMGMRALIALLGVPVIYGNLGAVLGRIGLAKSMLNIISGAAMTMGLGFIIVALIRGW